MTASLRPFGRTGAWVSPLTLGAMNFGARANTDHAEGIRTIHRALDAGITVIDTADVYSHGESEEIVGQALAGGRRDDVFLASKVHGQIGGNIHHRGNSRRWIYQAVEHSLRRLGTDWIDLYQVHRPEEETAFEETLGALSDLVREGKIRYIGTSTFDASQVVEGQWIAERRALQRVVAEQPPYSILTRGIERELLPVAQRYGLAVIPWSPLAGGWLANRHRRGIQQPRSGRADQFPARFDPAHPANAAKLKAAILLGELADEIGLSLIELSVAWTLEHPAITSVIIGPRDEAQLEDHLRVPEITLTADVLDRIDEIVPPGVNLNPLDAGWIPTWITKPGARRGGVHAERTPTWPQAHSPATPAPLAAV